jgi:hypothetical protein
MNRCQNCDWFGPDDQLGEIADLFQRVAPGEPMPSGECPVCLALCQPAYAEETEHIVSIEITVTASSVDEAVEFALNDLRDPAMEWTDFTVTNTDTQEVTNVNRSEATA